MNRFHFYRRTFIGLFSFLLVTGIQASSPLWTFLPLTNTHVSVSPPQIATIQYLVTNQSRKSHTLLMRPINGISHSVLGGGYCPNPFSLGYQQSCILSLEVNSSALMGDILGGPVICQVGNYLQCYQPDFINSLAIQLIKLPPIQQYTITPSAGANGIINPNIAQVVNSGATLTLTATPDAGYGVAQWLVDGNLVQTGGINYQLNNVTADHSVTVNFDTVVLTPSVSTLSLSVNCQPSSSCTTTENIALTGNSRQISIQNTGAVGATHVSVSTSGLPPGTLISNNTCVGTLNAGDSCTITLTPGAVASSDINSTACTSGTEPIEGTILITAEGGISTQVNALILGYGCQYQGGFLYSVDDTTPNTSSIGGKVVTLIDQAAPLINSGAQATSILWASNGNVGTNVNNTSKDIIPLIAEASTPNDSYNQAQTVFNNTYSNTGSHPFPPSSAFTSCSGESDGSCNTVNILAFYQTYITGYNITPFPPYVLSTGPTNPAYYAAGLCTAMINTYSDWYLPAICEMDSVNTGISCPVGAQSMLSSLPFLNGNPGATIPSTSCAPPSGTDCLAGSYWSSTETSDDPSSGVWTERYATSGLRGQFRAGEANIIGVRCSRAIAP